MDDEFSAAVSLLLASCLLFGCSPALPDKPKQGVKQVAATAAEPAPEPKKPAVASSGYFPTVADSAGARCDPEGISESHDQWYSKHLRAAGEPSLFEASRSPRPPGAATYRFTWLRSFHHPVVIRVETGSNGEARLIAKELSGHGGYGPGEIRRHMQRKLSPDETRRLGSALAATRLLTWPARDCSGIIGLDGAHWIVEARDRTGYHLVDRWSPERGPMREVGELMLGLTGWQYGDVY
jgi:hypothetical protein